MKTYHYRDVALRWPVVAIRLERLLQPAGSTIWPPKHRAYGGEGQGLLRHAPHFCQVAARLFLPVILLAVLLEAAFLYSDAQLVLAGAPLLVQNSSLVLSDLVLPLTWTTIHLTNRRHGANYALAQLFCGLCVLVLTVMINPDGLNDWATITPALSSRALAAFVLSFVLANVMGIILFEAIRGPEWWRAPLVGSFAVSLVFSLTYYPVAFAGQDSGWANSALVHFALFFGESLFLLAPYGLLRPAMRPLHGRNGY